MNGLAILIPVALFLGMSGLVAFLWALRKGQFEDLDGAAMRILIEDEEEGEGGAKARMKVCPNCEERLKDDAIVCTHCGHQLAPIPAVADSGEVPTPNAIKLGCGILILILFALILWTFSASLQR